MADMLSSTTEIDLEDFRRRWRDELASKDSKARQPATSGTSAGPAQDISPSATSRPSTSPHRDEKGPASPSSVSINPPSSPRSSRRLSVSSKGASAVEIYSAAVEAEREGVLGDALNGYRRAFKLDPDVDKAYHRLTLAHESHSSARSKSISGKGKERAHGRAEDDEFGFEFSRTFQTEPDYHAAEAVKRSKERHKDEHLDLDLNHPSSTERFKRQLLLSFAANPFPFQPDDDDVGHERSGSRSQTAVSPDVRERTLKAPTEIQSHLDFHPRDEEAPIPISRIPSEILQHILASLVCTSPSAVSSLEMFGRVSRRARLESLDQSIWRNVCERIYKPPCQLAPGVDAETTVKELHAGDWRRMFIEHPRIRSDGCFISVATYVRRGESENAWFSPTHLVTFYRYLRFHPSGQVLSLLTTDTPSDTVKKLKPGLRRKGFTIGKWRLRGNQITCWDLEEPGVGEGERKYSFVMECELKSTSRGKMNKLNLLSISTINMRTAEVVPVPLKHVKPFFFSRVLSWE